MEASRQRGWPAPAEMQMRRLPPSWLRQRYWWSRSPWRWFRTANGARGRQRQLPQSERAAARPPCRTMAAAHALLSKLLTLMMRRQLPQGAAAVSGGPSLPWWYSGTTITAALAMGAFTAISICGGAWARMHLGIVPRTWSGLLGIFFGCFVHLSWYHCYWNALALLLLGSCVFQAIVPVPSQCGSETRHEDSSCGDATTSVPAEGLASGKVGTFMAISAFIALSSGFCVWCLARPVLHAGASGVVCGYLGLLLALTLRQRDVPLGALAMVLAVVACYGSAALMTRRAAAAGQPGFPGQSALYEVCVSQSHSTEHHTFGFLSGLAAALFFCRPSAPPRQEPRRVVGAPAEAAS
eukprot:TRINITY_DN66707_c0_g1_i2.p1 TRINITY_DN66707_c0_g1~~TRINITY_DN66707_c0_g1_i2.p1  ORF type:complete len:353 (+),score=50.90 TRINITY_DN66707_c0_g1_i2:315-1373(+)